MPAIFDYAHIVMNDEIDGLGHVNNLAYLRWMQDAAVAHSAAQGWPASRYLEINSGWVVRSHFIEYLRPAFAGEQVLIRTWVSTFKRITSLRKYKIIRTPDDVVLAVAETNWAFIELQRFLPRRIPMEVADCFEIVPADKEP